MALTAVPSYGTIKKTPVSPAVTPAAPISPWAPSNADAYAFSPIARTPEQIQTAVLGDPGYMKALSQSKFSGLQSRDALRTAIRNAVLQGGWDVSGQLGEYGSDIDPATLAAAQANPTSDKAVLQRQLDQGLSDLQYALAARGMLRSGALGAGSAGLNQSYQESANKSMNDLVNALQGGIGNYNNFLSQQQQQLNDLFANLGNQYGQQLVTPDTPWGLSDFSGFGSKSAGTFNDPGFNDYWNYIGAPQTGQAAAAANAAALASAAARRNR